MLHGTFTCCTLLQLRATLPDAVGGVLWFGPHAALTTVFTPFVAGMHASDSTFEVGHQGKKARHSFRAGHCSLTRDRRAYKPHRPTAVI
jgi:dipeptidase